MSRSVPGHTELRTDTEGKRLFVAVTGSGEVVVMDTERLTVARRIRVGEGPFRVAVPGNS
ncbi:hypothetical protein [Thiohalomonas denitrificans]|uniref:hypothetical protein n=1 Tax=Thiohalomonas denitrificans TaxID=415747 RepID=UPI0026EC2885|nr:hypothetical protein [Thiohalomonas denitrificans]